MKRVLSIFVIVGLLFELFLYSLGYKPGQLDAYNIFNETTNYTSTNFFRTSEFGVLSLSNEVVYESRQKATYTNTTNLLNFEGIDNVLNDFTLLDIFISKSKSKKEFLLYNSKFNWASEFALKAYENIKESGPDSALYQNYIVSPLNNHGFRSIHFKQDSSSKKKILLLGDSFGWGMSASPIFNSYADILLARGYLVFNTGIPGTDPAQYLAVLKEYLVEIKPDVVVVNLCLGNDFMTFPREAKKNEPLEHLLNNNFIESNPLGTYLKEEECAEFYKKLSTIPKNSFFNEVCSSTRTSTKIWQIFYTLGLVEHKQRTDYFNSRNKSIKEKAFITRPYFDEMKRLCESNSTELFHFVIPTTPHHFKKVSTLTKEHKEALEILYRGGAYYYLENLTKDDFEDHGGHFNNAGSLKHANLIDSIINKPELNVMF